MSDQLTVVDFDGDEAVAEAMVGLQEASATRGGFFRRAGAAAGGLGVAAAILPAFGGTAAAREGGSKKEDVKILNFALTLEYLEAAFYAEAVNRGIYSGSVLNFAQSSRRTRRRTSRR